MCALGFDFCPIQSSIFDMLEPNMVCLYIGSGFQVSVLHFSLDYLQFGLDDSTCQFLDALRNFFLSFIVIYSFFKFLLFFFFVFFFNFWLHWVFGCAQDFSSSE